MYSVIELQSSKTFTSECHRSPVVQNHFLYFFAFPWYLSNDSLLSVQQSGCAVELKLSCDSALSCWIVVWGILGSVFSGMWSLPALVAVDVCRCKAAFVIGLNVEISFEFFHLSLRHKHQAILFGYCFIIYLQYFIYKKKKMKSLYTYTWSPSTLLSELHLRKQCCFPSSWCHEVLSQLFQARVIIVN